MTPTLDKMDVATTSVRRQSHIVLTKEKYDKALAALTGLVLAP
jgi:hypothetical protein